MKVYLDITAFECNHNKVTGLDVSQNTALKKLVCYGNNLNNLAIDDIYCALYAKQPANYARISTVFNSTSPNHAVVMAINKQNGIDKGWKMQYWSSDTGIPVIRECIFVEVVYNSVKT